MCTVFIQSFSIIGTISPGPLAFIIPSKISTPLVLKLVSCSAGSQPMIGLDHSKCPADDVLLFRSVFGRFTIKIRGST